MAQPAPRAALPGSAFSSREACGIDPTTKQLDEESSTHKTRLPGCGSVLSLNPKKVEIVVETTSPSSMFPISAAAAVP